MSLLNLPLILETRRNHALEHATIHILTKNYPGRPIAGHSNPTGFFIMGDVPTEGVSEAVAQALTRLRAGERDLAIHPGCGTNYATSGLLAGSLAWFGMSGRKPWRKRLWRLPIVAVLAAAAYFVSQPLGPALQASVTTEAEMGNLEIVRITPIRRGRSAVHRIVTRS